jgi:hypothetical protein
MKASGLVEKVDGPNNYGFFNIVLRGHQKPFGMGKFAPKCKSGDTVEFDYSVNEKGYPNGVSKTLRVVAVGNGTQDAQASRHVAVDAVRSSSSSGTHVSLSRDDYWANKDRRDIAYSVRSILTQNEIRHQASRNSAIAFLDMAIKNGLLEIPEPTAKNKSKMDVLKTYLEKMTDQFYQDTLVINPQEVTAAEAVSFDEARAFQVDNF